MTRILVATDLSPRADRAVARAFRLADAHKAALTVLMVMDHDFPERVLSVLRTEALDHLNSFCEAQSGAASVDWTARIDTGDPAKDIQSVAKDIDADLIVLGLHRRRVMLDSLRETTLEYVVRHIRKPVLLVASQADEAYERVLTAVDFSPASTAALQAVRIWAPDAEVRAFHAVFTGMGRADQRDPDHIMAKAILNETRSSMDAWIADGGLPEGLAEPDIIDGALGAVFDAEMVKRKPNLIAFGAHARHGLAHGMLGGFARSLVRDPPTDLLIARRP